MPWGSRCLVYLFLLVIVSCRKSSSNVATINSFECTPGKELCPNMTCNTRMSRNRVHKINVGCFLPRPLYNLTADLALQRKNQGKYETFFKVKENMCEVARKTIRSQIMSRIFEDIKRYISNFKCPFQGNVTAVDMPIALSFAPGFLQESAYRVLVKIENVEELVISVIMHFSIGKNKFRKPK